MIATIVKLSWGKSYRSCGNHRPQVKYRKRVMMCFFMTSCDSKMECPRGGCKKGREIVIMGTKGPKNFLAFRPLSCLTIRN